MKLNLGCGPIYMPGYVNIDNRSQWDCKVDKDADVFTMDWDKDTCEEIVVSHLAMYIMGGQDTVYKPNQMKVLVKRWFSWLKKDGKLVLETTDIRKVAELLLSTTNPDKLNEEMKAIFGWDNTYGHKWSWSPETLVPIFEETGFDKVELGKSVFHPNDKNFIIVGTK